jgi:putative heme iron utilization protein
VLSQGNTRHQAALSWLAEGLAGPWLATGIDPEGLDLVSGDRTARVAFPHAIRIPGDFWRSTRC